MNRQRSISAVFLPLEDVEGDEGLTSVKSAGLCDILFRRFCPPVHLEEAEDVFSYSRDFDRFLS